MGMEDRDWYREKRIDWERGGLRERSVKERRFSKRAWWIALIILLIAGIVLYRMH
jgi:hypothetical protein